MRDKLHLAVLIAFLLTALAALPIAFQRDMDRMRSMCEPLGFAGAYLDKYGGGGCITKTE